MKDKRMHDWTLKNIEVTWERGTVRLDLTSRPGVIKSLTAHDFVELVVPRKREWGESESILSSDGPRRRSDGHQQLQILMQGGDTLLIVAREIIMPPAD